MGNVNKFDTIIKYKTGNLCATGPLGCLWLAFSPRQCHRSCIIFSSVTFHSSHLEMLPILSITARTRQLILALDGATKMMPSSLARDVVAERIYDGPSCKCGRWLYNVV